MLKKSPLLLLMLALVAGCSAPRERAAAPPDIYQRTSHQLAQAPREAAACIARNAQRLGYAADVRPLYGTEVMAVIARTRPAGGEDIAAVQLLPEGAASRAQVTTTGDTLGDRPGMITSLLAKC